MHIVDQIYFWARTIPRRPAIIQPSGIITYQALAEGIERAAEYFARNLTDRSKRVTVSLQSGPKMLVASLGLLRANCSIIVANRPDLSDIPHSDSNALVYERGETPLRDRTNIIFDESWLEVGTNLSRLSPPLNQSKKRHPDIIFFSSGTTGKPKRIVRTQEALDHCVHGASAFDNYERALLSTDVNSPVGFMQAYEILNAGKTICFAPPGPPMLWLANTYDVDLIIASQQQALALADLQEKFTHYSLAALKTVNVCGPMLFGDGIRRIKRNLCRNVILTYSTAEVGIVAVASHDMITDLPGAVGYVMPGVDVEIVDTAGRVLPIGKEGFVRVRSLVLAENLAGGGSSDEWFYPGDLGWLTETNVLCIACSATDAINRGGEKLSITDVEEFLLNCLGVKDAGVCTVTGRNGLSEVWVGLVLERSADVAALRHTIESNPQLKNNIDRIFIVEAIPRGLLGKVQSDELEKMLNYIGAENGWPA